MTPRPSRIISGGQTGADRAGLDAAIHLGIPWGGWAPREWMSEDRNIPMNYRAGRSPEYPGGLTENGLWPVDGNKPMPGEMTFAAAYRERTELNVRDCDAALLFVWDKLTPGTRLTLRLLEEARKPHAVVSIRAHFTIGDVIEQALRWLDAPDLRGTLLVAGSRESKAPGIYAYTYTILREALR